MNEILQSSFLMTPCSFDLLRGSRYPYRDKNQLPGNFRNEISGILLRLKLILINEQKKNYLFITMRTMLTGISTTKILILDHLCILKWVVRLPGIRIVSKQQGKSSFCPNKIGVFFACANSADVIVIGCDERLDRYQLQFGDAI